MKTLFEESLSKSPSGGLNIGYGKIVPIWSLTERSLSKTGEFVYSVPFISENGIAFASKQTGENFSQNEFLIIDDRCSIIVEIFPEHNSERIIVLRLSCNGCIEELHLKNKKGSEISAFYFLDNESLAAHQIGVVKELLDNIIIYQKLTSARNWTKTETIPDDSVNIIDPAYCESTIDVPNWWRFYYISFLTDTIDVIGWNGPVDTTVVDESIGGGGGSNGHREHYSLPRDLRRFVGTSDYYNERYIDYENRIGPNPQIYYKNYGDYYYNEFMLLKNSGTLSSMGNEWVDKTARLLQSKLEDVLRNNPYIELYPNELKNAAFSTHPSAYLEGGFLSLSMQDKIHIALTVKKEDLFSWDGINQIMVIAYSQIKYYQQHPGSLMSDAAYIQSHWSQIKMFIIGYLLLAKSVDDRTVEDVIDLVLGQQIQYYYQNVPGFYLPEV